MRQQHPGGMAAPSGAVAAVVTRNLGALQARRKAPLAWRLKNWLTYRWRELPALVTYRLLGVVFGLVYVESALRLTLRHADGTVTDFGVVSRRVVTTAGVGFIVDAFQNLVELENLKFHGFGTGTTAEASGDTALVTELTTEYATDNTRPTGTTTEGASANIYRTVATLSPNAGGTIAITEHGIFDQAANSGGVLLDRSVFSAVNLVASADSLQATYELTLAAGS
jgi:hypothetical protein